MSTLMLLLLLLAPPPMQDGCGTDIECGCTVDCLQQMNEGAAK